MSAGAYNMHGSAWYQIDPALRRSPGKMQVHIVPCCCACVQHSHATDAVNKMLAYIWPPAYLWVISDDLWEDHQLETICTKSGRLVSHTPKAAAFSLLNGQGDTSLQVGSLTICRLVRPAKHFALHVVLYARPL